MSWTSLANGYGRKERKEGSKHVRNNNNFFRDDLEGYDSHKHKKKADSKKKPFGIAWRRNKKNPVISNLGLFSNKWKPYKWYSSEKDRKKAFEKIQKNYQFWEFKLIER